MAHSGVTFFADPCPQRAAVLLPLDLRMRGTQIDGGLGYFHGDDAFSRWLYPISVQLADNFNFKSGGVSGGGKTTETAPLCCTDPRFMSGLRDNGETDGVAPFSRHRGLTAMRQFQWIE